MEEISITELSSACGDTFVGAYGDHSAYVNCVASFASVREGALIFSRKAVDDWGRIFSALRQGVCFVPSPIELAGIEIPSGIAVIECENPRLAFARCVKVFFSKSTQVIGVHPTAVIEEGVYIHPTASIGAHCYIGSNTTVGENSIIFSNVTILCPTNIGANVNINSGTVIGADGFGYEKNAEGKYEKFPHLGGVVIEDDVDIGANTCIDRGVLNNTVIRAGAKIDNLVHVAHNCDIGEGAMVIACTMLGGSVKIGSGSWIAPASTIINQKIIGDQAIVGLGSLVTKDVENGQTVMGAPAMDQANFKVRNSAIKKLVATHMSSES